jgi:large subunit ribosomal protein L10
MFLQNLLKNLDKKSEKPLLKQHLLKNQYSYFGDNQLTDLANLKSKEELIGDIIALLQSPMKNVLGQL